MSSDNTVISVQALGKRYEIYDRPGDRLKQFILPRASRALGLPIRQHFREFWALNDVSFEVGRGETVGIIGRNGSGKSTLLQMICGTLNPTSGSIRVQGKVAALLELGSGFNPEFTGRENVHMNAALLGLQSEQIESRFDDIVAFADIGDHIEQPVKTYSSGMLVRLAFAVIAHVDADVLVIDEALAVGDAFFTQKCMRFLRMFMQNGTVLFVSHDTASIKNLCDRAIWLDQGRVVASGTPKDVCEQYLEAFYEAQQGKSSSTRRIEKVAITGGATSKDQRSELINGSTLRNDLRVFEFNPDAASFGTGHAQIRGVQLLNENGLPMSWIIGGEPVSLRIAIAAHEPLHNPIVGFFLKDSLGQTLFGDNTYLTYKDQAISIDPGEMFQAGFAFLMPILPSGNYSIQVAIATGTQDAHVQHQWIHDALILKSESTSASTGLMGIPMSEISIRRIASADS